jgi:hypothetical protein
MQTHELIPLAHTHRLIRLAEGLMLCPGLLLALGRAVLALVAAPALVEALLLTAHLAGVLLAEAPVAVQLPVDLLAL